MSRNDNDIDRAASTVFWILDKSPFIVAAVATGAAYAVDGARTGLRGAITVAAILITYFVAYGAGICDKFIEEDKRERAAHKQERRDNGQRALLHRPDSLGLYCRNRRLHSWLLARRERHRESPMK